ncbi:MAG: hypothetical protein TH68_07715 [Candidatus Synechococcus spongiarum 142]|uniref:Uncharacterized protein n=1 Tax=Candidatus Synechococcus spongiarum 142 TaxID=1608213 RepID=A0A6N3X3M2_9SYNE|nr:MAG: hypothetical protein TH68_07715 [Candidatus Synechococcus spongiarum 142]
MHTADWQLGKGFANIPGDAGGALRDQRMETVRAVGRLATARGVDSDNPHRFHRHPGGQGLPIGFQTI